MIEDPRELEQVDRQIHIDELKAQARQLGGPEMSIFEDEQAPPEALERFWQNVLSMEGGPWVTDRQQLEDQGLHLPPPHSMTDEQLQGVLTDLLRRLAELGTYLCHTNHLSDRRLYEDLWHETLDERHVRMDIDAGGAWVVDMLGAGSEDDIYLHLKHYADLRERRQWMREWPDYEMPDHQDPPYDRDSSLPRPPE